MIDQGADQLAFSHLVPPSPVALDLLRLLCRQDRNRVDLVKHVMRDPATVAALLREASAAGVARGNAPIDLDTAIARLGETRVRHIVVNQALGAMKIQSIRGYALDDYDFWRSALVCAHAAERIGKAAGLDSGVMYIVGLLLDVGKVAISRRLPDTRWTVDGVRPDVLESDLAGLDHAEAGAIVVDAWGLWEPIPTCVRFHHRPSEAHSHQAEVACAHLASWVSQWMGVPTGCDGLAYGLEPGALATLGLTDFALEEVAVAVLEGIQAA
ncbi:MAG: HDOD domain-containing protein [Myxococcales bacterium]|nr:HDOD domain-containing protein [Myxococcales bacterium]